MIWAGSSALPPVAELIAQVDMQAQFLGLCRNLDKLVHRKAGMDGRHHWPPRRWRLPAILSDQIDRARDRRMVACEGQRPAGRYPRPPSGSWAMATLANYRLATVRDRALLLIGFAGAFPPCPERRGTSSVVVVVRLCAGGELA